MPILDNDRLFPVDSHGRGLAKRLFASIKDLPIVSPHGHTNAEWFAKNLPFENPTSLFVTPDHYVFRMLFSQGIKLEDLGIQRRDESAVDFDPRKVWGVFAENYFLFRGTPSRLWVDYSLQEVFGVEKPLSASTADEIYDQISECLPKTEFLPRSLFERFKIEVLATTEGPLDALDAHREIIESGWTGRVVTTYRPDTVVDPEAPDFQRNLVEFGEITNEDTMGWEGYLRAHRKSRAVFKTLGATATDHGHPSARTANLSQQDCRRLFDRIRSDRVSKDEAELFRAQMLTEMAKMSIDDGLVMQIHPGSHRNHSRSIFESFGTDKGFDIPKPMNFVTDLQPLLDVAGLDPNFHLIVFTLDESTYSRELAPLAGAYPCLKLGPPWWFLDSPDGMRRFRELTVETAGFYNTVGFNDDTRAFCSIPARHDVARRVDCSYLSSLVTTGRLSEEDAFEVAYDLTYRLVKQAYRL